MGEDFISSQACPYSTVAEFFENNSEVRAYANTAVKPAPNRITNRLVILAVDLTTFPASEPNVECDISVYAPFPPVLSSAHFF